MNAEQLSKVGSDLVRRCGTRDPFQIANALGINVMDDCENLGSLKGKPSFKAKHEAELVIFEAARSTLLAMQGEEKLPSLKTLQAEQQRLLEEQQRLYDERAKLKKEARIIDTMKANVDDFLKPNAERDQEHQRNSQRE